MNGSIRTNKNLTISPSSATVRAMTVQPESRDQQEAPVAGILGEPFIEYTPPSWDVYFMRLSYEAATKSKDPSSKFGAIITKDNRVILTGYNGLPPKVRDYSERLTRPIKYKWVLHAEANIFAGAAKFGIATEGGTLYVSATPCCGCANMIVASGIQAVVLHRPAVDIFTKSSPYGEDNEVTTTIFKEAGVVVRYVEMFIGKTAYIGGRKYNI